MQIVKGQTLKPLS